MWKRCAGKFVIFLYKKYFHRILSSIFIWRQKGGLFLDSTVPHRSVCWNQQTICTQLIFWPDWIPQKIPCWGKLLQCYVWTHQERRQVQAYMWCGLKDKRSLSFCSNTVSWTDFPRAAGPGDFYGQGVLSLLFWLRERRTLAFFVWLE